MKVNMLLKPNEIVPEQAVEHFEEKCEPLHLQADSENAMVPVL